ncbi:MAG: benzoylformate decarboxylase [Burkholderiaceae bacterium]
MSPRQSDHPTVREAFIRLMRDFGIDTIFGNPGSTELPMFRQFPADMRYVLGLQESVVVGMADGYAQATKGVAMVNLHSAVGVGHAMGNIFTAYKNQTPLIITAGQQARSILPFDPYLFAMQSTDLPKPYVKWACEPARAADAPLAFARAYFTATQAPRGPVFLSIPADDWDAETDWVVARSVSQTIGPDPGLLETLCAALNHAKRPVIIAGAGVARDGAVDRLVSLAEQHQAAVYAAPMSARCSFPERHTLFMGFLPPMREKIVAQLQAHDFILVLGAPVFTYHIEGSGPHMPIGADCWQIVDDPNTAAWTPTGHTIVSSIHLALDVLINQTAGPPNRHAPPARTAPPEPVASVPMSAAFVLKALDEVRSEHDVIVEEAPGTRTTMQQYLPMDGEDRFYTMASGGLGWGMPATVGVALGRKKLGLPGRVIGLIGDGSAMYAIQSLYSAAELGLPLTFVIMNNRRYAALQEFAPVFGYAPGETPVGTDLAGIDFVKLAEAQGIQAARVDHPDQLKSSLLAALDAEGPYLLEVVMS